MKATFICLACGFEKPAHEIAEKIDTRSLGGESCRYVCKDCANVFGYKQEERMNKKDDCKGRKRSLHVLAGTEWEAVFASRSNACALAAKPYYGVLTRDGSLPNGGIEVKFPPAPLASLSKSIEGWVEFSDPTYPQCGQHINVSAEEWDQNVYYLIDEYKDILFHDLMAEVACDGDDNFFGRSFNHYANYPFTGDHYDAVRVKKHSNCIEFRLCKYREGFTPRRFYLIISMIVEMMEKLDVWFVQKVDNGKNAYKAADMAAKKIAEVYRSYQNGTARAIKRGVIDWE